MTKEEAMARFEEQRQASILLVQKYKKEKEEAKKKEAARPIVECSMSAVFFAGF